MSKKLISSSILSAIADFIRSKKGTQDTYKPTEFVEEINEVYDDKQPVLQTKSATPTTSAQVIEADSGYDGLEQVNISAIQLQEKTVTPSLSYQDVTPDTGKDGLSKVRVNKMNLHYGEVKSRRNQNYYYYPTSEYDGFDYIFVQMDPVNLQNKTVTPSGSQQVITSSLDYDGLGEVTVEAVSSDVDPYIQDYNIKNGVTILGVTGTYTGTNINKASQILCKTATEIVLDDIAGMTSISEGQLNNFYNLVSLVLPNTISSIASSAFDTNSNLTAVYYNGTIDYWIAGISRPVNYGGSVFCGNNAYFYILDNNGCVNYDGRKYSLVTSISITGGTIQPRCFSEYGHLTSIDFSNFTGSAIGQGAFEYCHGLTSITITTSNTYGFTISRYAFSNCSNLASVTLDNTNTSFTLQKYAFQYAKLDSLIILGTYTVTLEDTSVLQYTNISRGTGYIYVPDSLVNSYKTASIWSNYASQIKGLSELPQS